MIAKIAILLAIAGVAIAGYANGGGAAVAVPSYSNGGILTGGGGGVGIVPAGAGVGPADDLPPPKSVTYNVPAVSKVSYPGQALTRSVETYSAPSIEKTTTITRTITAPINAPAERQVSYAAPSQPIVRAAAPVIAAPIGFASPLSYGGAGLGGGLGLATTYSAPALGYNLGGHQGLAYAAAPSYGYAAAPSIAYAAAPSLALSAAPLASYGAPAAAPIATYGAPAIKGGY